MSEAMKPCPFCKAQDNKLFVRDTQERAWEGPLWEVGCEECGASIGYFGTKEKALFAWNHRPTESELGEVLLAIQAEVDKYERRSV